MSGGSMDYLYSKLEYGATFVANTPERRAFAVHIKKVAKALHDIEWVDSGDCPPGSENEAIRTCLGEALILEALIEQAQETREMLRVELERVRNQTKGDKDGSHN